MPEEAEVVGREGEQMIDIKKLVVGQEVIVDGGCGLADGKVISIEPPFVYVESNGRFRFNADGKECDINGKVYTHKSVMYGPGPFTISVGSIDGH